MSLTKIHARKGGGFAAKVYDQRFQRYAYLGCSDLRFQAEHITKFFDDELKKTGIFDLALAATRMRFKARGESATLEGKTNRAVFVLPTSDRKEFDAVVRWDRRYVPVGRFPTHEEALTAGREAFREWYCEKRYNNLDLI